MAKTKAPSKNNAPETLGHRHDARSAELSALHLMACEKGDVDLARELIAAGARACRIGERSALREAILRRMPDDILDHAEIGCDKGWGDSCSGDAAWLAAAMELPRLERWLREEPSLALPATTGFRDAGLCVAAIMGSRPGALTLCLAAQKKAGADFKAMGKSYEMCVARLASQHPHLGDPTEAGWDKRPRFGPNECPSDQERAAHEAIWGGDDWTRGFPVFKATIDKRRACWTSCVQSLAGAMGQDELRSLLAGCKPSGPTEPHAHALMEMARVARELERAELAQAIPDPVGRHVPPPRL